MPLFSRLMGYHPWQLIRPRRFWDWEHFGLTARELNALMEFPRWTISPMIQPELTEKSTIGKDGFEVTMDVQQFKPNEISVKTVDDTVIVEGKHDEREDEHGIVARHFIRKYSLPQGFDSKQIMSQLSSDGILTIKAPFPKEALENRKERVISIEHTGPARLKFKEKSEQEKTDEKNVN